MFLSHSNPQSLFEKIDYMEIVISLRDYHLSQECLESHKKNMTTVSLLFNMKLRLGPRAILIRPAGGRTYADLLKEIQIKPDDSDSNVRAIRETRTGGVLLEPDRKITNRDSVLH
ncbi:hypothetical protein J6590_097138 [Homalodisca vitripennis]|nr:hypothetical protein J6590_097138 [Homalodisca vitripennis]